jgi:hypothetical protein
MSVIVKGGQRQQKGVRNDREMTEMAESRRIQQRDDRDGRERTEIAKK